MANYCQKLKTLLWKNCKIKVNNRSDTLCSIILPLVAIALYTVILIVVVHQMKPEKKIKIDNKSDKKNPSKVHKWEIHYIKSSTYVTNIMNELRMSLAEQIKTNETTIILLEHANEKEMKRIILKGKCILAVIFKNGRKITSSSKKLHVTVRSCLSFPTQSPFFEPPIAKSGYLRNKEGFLDIQFALVEAILKVDNVSSATPDVTFEHFPTNNINTYGVLADMYLLSVMTFVMLLFTSCTNYYTWDVAKEKENQMKETMKNLGLSTGLQWFAWFIIFFAILLILTIIMTVIFIYVPKDIPMLPKSNIFLLLLFMILSACVIIATCILFTTFCDAAFSASTFCTAFWFSTFLIYVLLIHKTFYDIKYRTKLLMCIIAPWGIFMGLRAFSVFEKAGFGMQWKYMFKELDFSEDLTLGTVMLILLCDFILYLLIANYIDSVCPGKYGTPKPYNYMFKFLGRDKKSATQKVDLASSDNPDNIENEPEDHKVGIEVRRLNKKFGHVEVVKDFNLKVYEGQITVLLGHNGAGKTTTMSMITGLMKPSSGTVFVDGYDISKHFEKINFQMAMCSQNNVIFESLTVRDHLYFFCKVRGLSGEQLHNEVTKYIKQFQLEHVMKRQAARLSGVEQRKLSVSLSFCGGTKFVVLDEPSSNMDPRSRRQLWILLEELKADRTILMSTHFMDEADTLGDRIAIMHKGVLESCGSPFFLNKKYGTGYTLTIVKQPDCNTAAVTQALQSRIPTVNLLQDRKSEISYRLRNEDSSLFESLLSNLEQRKTALHIENFGLSVTTLEEVFLRIGAEVVPEEVSNTEDKQAFEMLHVELKKGSVMRFLQLHALFMKRTLYTWRFWIGLPLLIILMSTPVAFVVMLELSSEDVEVAADPFDPITLDLNLYKNLEVPIENKSVNEEMNKVCDTYKQITGGFFVKNTKAKLEKMLKDNPVEARSRYVFGATFKDENKAVAWYNLEAIHSIPLSLLMVQNAVLKENLGKTLTLVNHPVPKKEHNIISESITMGGAFYVIMILSIGFAFLIVIYVDEQASCSKHLMFTTGVPAFMYWIFSFVWDMFFYLLSMSITVCAIYLMKEDDPHVHDVAAAVVVAFVTFGFCMLPVLYLLSFAFQSRYVAFSTVMLIVPLSGIPTLLTYMIKEWNTKMCHKMCFSFSPAASMIEYLLTIGTIWDSGLWNKLYDFDDGVMHRVILFILEGILFFALLFMIDYGVFRRIFYACFRKKGFITVNRVASEDPNVLETEKMIHDRDIEELKQDYELVVNTDLSFEPLSMDFFSLIHNSNVFVCEMRRDHRDLTKKYSQFDVTRITVDHISFTVEKGECFGLLGMNGAGKTTAFKMMLGVILMSEGDVYMLGKSMKKLKSPSTNCIGYCPQSEALISQLTTRETLYIYALIKGIPPNHIKNTIYELSDAMLFTQHLDKKIENLSGGTKRKVSAAIALMSYPPLILLDEPTTGIDPEAKRKMWDLLSAVRENGSGIVLCSHSMDECEAICTRLTIMVKGRLKCIGSIEHLKSTFSKEMSLMIKGKTQEATSEDRCHMKNIKEFVKTTFPESYIIEEHLCFVHFNIKPNMPLSKMFGTMENAKKTMNFEDYFLGQCTLEQVFMKLIRM